MFPIHHPSDAARMIRPLGIGFLFAILASVGLAKENGVVSFVAQIVESGAEISSAPGTTNFYPTGTLRGGDSVEVFFKTADGWCAIRPPAGSFSWINGAFVRAIDDQRGVVVSPQEDKEVPIRVGADSVMKSSGVQVGLKPGRTVALLGETTLTGGQTWYRIEPPAGEFRWVHESRLVLADFLARLPNHLTRESDLAAPLNPSAPLNPAAGGIPLENYPSTPPPAMLAKAPLRVPTPLETFPEPIFNVAHSPQIPQINASGFSLELARLSRDLFTAIERGAGSELYDLLADRAATLFDAAENDTQRMEVRRIYDRIGLYRTSQTASVFQQPDVSVAHPAGTLYRHPLAARNLVPEEQRLAFTPPVSTGISGGTEKMENKNMENKSGIRFAFADGNHPLAGFDKIAAAQTARGERKSGIFPSGPSVIVPPANYPPPSGGGTNSATPLTSPTPLASPTSPVEKTGQLPGPANPSSRISDPPSAERPVPFLASHVKADAAGGEYSAAEKGAGWKSPSEMTETDESAENRIRPVSVLLPNQTDALPVTSVSQRPVDLWRSPSGIGASGPNPLGFPPSTGAESAFVANQAVVKHFEPFQQPFDAAGILGWFPNPPEGYPPYALVKNNNGRLVILCYVAPDRGKSLDGFIGKSIGVSGTRGWFKRGDENRKLITAKSILLLDSSVW